MFLAIAALLFGFVLLIKGADILIDGATALAKRIGISELIVGLTVVAFGTSLPELVVNLLANSPETLDIAIGNVIGSNIANIFLILGVSALIHPLTVKRVTVWREILFAFGSALLLGALVADNFLVDSNGFAGLDRIDGIVLIAYFVIFLYYTFGSTPVSQEQADKEIAADHNLSIGKDIALIGAGIAGLLFGGRFIVYGASTVAAGLGLSNALIGLTVVAIGTSAPELAASITAVKKRNIDIAVGNAVGSNLFNTFWVLGLSAMLNPLPFENKLYFDVGVSAVAAGLLFGLMASTKHPKHTLTKYGGVLFIALYVVYTVMVVIRG